MWNLTAVGIELKGQTLAVSEGNHQTTGAAGHTHRINSDTVNTVICTAPSEALPVISQISCFWLIQTGIPRVQKAEVK